MVIAGEIGGLLVNCKHSIRIEHAAKKAAAATTAAAARQIRRFTGTIPRRRRVITG